MSNYQAKQHSLSFVENRIQSKNFYHNSAKSPLGVINLTTYREAKRLMHANIETNAQYLSEETRDFLEAEIEILISKPMEQVEDDLESMGIACEQTIRELHNVVSRYLSALTQGQHLTENLVKRA